MRQAIQTILLLLKDTKISLIFPSCRTANDPVSLKEAKEHLGIIPPLSLAYVAHILVSISGIALSFLI